METFCKSEDLFSNLNDTCRTCSKSKPKSLQQIFNSEMIIYNEEKPLSTFEVLVAVSTLKMQPDDELPKGICHQCIENLQKAYNFQKMCINSDASLRRFILSNECNINLKEDQIRKRFDNDEPGIINLFDLPISSENKSFENCNTSFIDFSTEINNLKIEKASHDYKLQDNIEPKKSIKEEEPEGILSGELEASYNESTNSDNEEHFNVNNKILSIDPEIEKPNPRNKRNGCFICEDCGKTFDRQHRLRRHASVHKKEGRPFECAHCKRRFAQEGHLKRHILIHDKTFLEHADISKNPGGHQCPECPRKFLKQVSLASHMRTHRKDVDVNKRFQCEECLKEFEGLYRLNRHKKLHQENHKYICKTCGKSFGFKAHLIDHLSKHTGIKPHNCRYCGKSFQQTGTLKDHLRTHTGEQPFLCSECGKGFKNASNLRQHELRHRDVKPYQCPKCPSKFALKSDLSKHMNTHANEKPYSCDICGSRFTKNSSVKKHKLIHTGEKPYPCDCCDMSFFY